MMRKAARTKNKRMRVLGLVRSNLVKMRPITRTPRNKNVRP